MAQSPPQSARMNGSKLSVLFFFLFRFFCISNLVGQYSLQKVLIPELPDISMGTREASTLLIFWFRDTIQSKQQKVNLSHYHLPQTWDVGERCILTSGRYMLPAPPCLPVHLV